MLLCFLRSYIIDHSEGAELYPCQRDEWTRVTFADYSVSLPDAADSWVLVFRLESSGILYLLANVRPGSGKSGWIEIKLLQKWFKKTLLTLLREVFQVHKEMQLVPKVYSPVPNCLLHVINNDTGEELDMLFNKVAPHVYRPNKVCGSREANPKRKTFSS